MSAVDRDDLLPPPIGDCPICGEPLDDAPNVIWSDTAHGWVHEACAGPSDPAPPSNTDKETE